MGCQQDLDSKIASEVAAMTIQITQPEVEAIIRQRLDTGSFKDAEDVILQALRSSPNAPGTPARRGSIIDLFAKVRGMADDIDFCRNPSTGRPVDLP
jgi:hypothetical protein